MMNKITYLFLLLANSIFAQINYEKAYFIDNSGIRTECLIKNEDWRNNPNKFYYKINEDSPENVKSIFNVKEFAVEGFSRYERHEVLIDTSSVDLQNLGGNRNPEWSKRTLFLKLIVDGDAKLYEYIDGAQKNYFYSFKGSIVEQLVYKEYIHNQELGKNNYYLQQLLNNVKCNETKKERISRIGYKLGDLTKYFLEVNNCDGNKAVTTMNLVKNNSGFTNLKIKGGLNLSKLTINTTQNTSTVYPVEFENKQGLNAGIEIEHVLAFNRNKWAIFYEPSFQSYSSEVTKIVPSNTPYDWKVNFKTIDHRLGLRHYMFLKQQSKLFFSAGLIFKQILGKQQITLKVNGNDAENGYLDLESGVGLNVGFGFSYRKSDFEIRYSKPDILATYVMLNSDYNTISVIYGYKIFDFKKKK